MIGIWRDKPAEMIVGATCTSPRGSPPKPQSIVPAATTSKSGRTKKAREKRQG